MIAILAAAHTSARHTLADAHRRMRRVFKWIRRHPVRTVAFIATAWLLMSILGGHVILAYAADGDLALDGATSGLPFMAPINPTDSGGVSLAQYISLPMDRGDLLHPHKFIIAQIVDPIWAFNLTGLSWGLWFLQFLVTMEWLDWIIPPIEGIFSIISHVLGQVGWVPVALALAAIVGFAAIMSGAVAKGTTEMLISLAAYVLSLTLLINPIGLITGPDGALRKTQAFSASLAASIAHNDVSYLENPPSADTAREVVGETVIAQVMDAWIRNPSQEIVFGQVLEGQCAETYNTAMAATTPFGDTGPVRDAIKSCAPEAAEQANNPNFGFIAATVFASGGGQSLNILTVALGFILLIASGYTVWNAGKWLIANYAAMLPGVARRAWWSAGLGILAGLFGVGASIVLVSAVLSIITSVMTLLANNTAFSTIGQMAVISMFVFAGAILLIWNFIKAKKAGEKFADRLARLGFGSASRGSRPRPIADSARRVGERFVSSALTWNAHQRAAAAAGAAAGTTAAAAQAPAGAETVFTATRPAAPAQAQLSPGSGKTPDAGPVIELTQLETPKSGNVKAAASKMLGTGVSVGLAAATGGTSAVVMTLTQEGGKYILQRGIEQAQKNKAPAPETRADEAPALESTAGAAPAPATFTAFGRQIVVGPNGESQIAPVQPAAPTAAFTPPSAPATPAADALRKRLERAAAAASPTVGA